jgi:hypothetical protein
MIGRTAVCLLLASLAAAAPLSAAPQRFSGNGHFFEAVDPPLFIDWRSARELTESRGGYLATIHSEAENQFAFAVADAQRFWRPGILQNYGPWIGGFQAGGAGEPGGGWQWVTGEPFDYTAWRSGEPNDFGLLDENAVHLLGGPGNREALWNDTWSGDPLHGFVIEWNSFPSWRYGDFNGDLTVNLDDFGVLKQNFGRHAGPAEGNTDFDRHVDLNDFGVLKENFGRTFSPEGVPLSAAVPEPGALALALVAAGVLLAGCPRRLAGAKGWWSAEPTASARGLGAP